MSAFEEFLETVGESERGFVCDINALLEENGCAVKIKPAKSGYVVSYLRDDTKKTLMNFVMRKSGVQARIYAAGAGEYGDLLNALPDKMKARIRKANDCRKLTGTGDDPKCPGGYEFTMDGEVFQKCRNNAFLIPVSEENYPFILKILEKELGA